MPNEIKLENGKLSVKLETGEVFTGDPVTVATKMASAHCSTKRWGQKHRDEKETAQGQVKNLQAKVDSLQAQVDFLTPRKTFWDDLPVISEVSQYN